jgi:hypothetical protein
VSQPPARALTTAVESCLARSGAVWRSVAEGEWGLRADAGGWPLDIGLALRGGLLRAQAQVLAPGHADAHALLHRNRRSELARLSHSGDGTVWVQGEIPAAAACLELEVDRLLGALVALADDVRSAAG